MLPLVYSSPYPFRGEDLALTESKGSAKPGLDQPPPCLGEGDRDNDMMNPGVLGIGDNGGTMAGAVSPDVAPESWFPDVVGPEKYVRGSFTLDERRRCWECVD